MKQKIKQPCLELRIDYRNGLIFPHLVSETSTIRHDIGQIENWIDKLEGRYPPR